MAFRQGDAVRVIASHDYPGAIGKIGTIVDPEPGRVEWISLSGINSATMDGLCGYPSFREYELAPANTTTADASPAKKSSGWWW
ncbi:hypothetical protein ACIRPT_13005 [Streptomyces sp. NPDC101227]|uniref:hypothetical protein n=1 Tax=Streptomyces sp. NPDC101227 TaxID=3366136 RepID=UPI00380F1479